MKKLIALVIAVLLAGCAAVTKVEGEQVVNGRLTLTVDHAWNRLSGALGGQPYETWTQDGPSLDHLRIWAGIAAGEPLMKYTGRVPAGQTAPRVPTFTAGMAPDQLVTLFEQLYAVDGSTVKVAKVEPATFAGEKGVRFEFNIARKRDDLQLKGVGWAAVRGNELFAATFVAPQVAFFPKLFPKASGIVATAKIKG
ncbi:MAG: hypothetical protein HY854_24590 [Burkholderiales bacterium]|nr:hypothetical protein [Burkholderiales bacterium]